MRKECAYISTPRLPAAQQAAYMPAYLKHVRALAKKHPDIRAWVLPPLCLPQGPASGESGVQHAQAICSIPHYVKSCGHLFVLEADNDPQLNAQVSATTSIFQPKPKPKPKPKPNFKPPGQSENLEG